MKQIDPVCACLSNRAYQKICAANGGRFPQNLWQWRRVAARFDKTIRFLRCPGPFTGMWCNDLIIIRWFRNRPAVDRYLTHEIAEVCLTLEDEPPFVVPAAYLSRHEVARQVEQIALT